jgi:hypothetical protein
MKTCGGGEWSASGPGRFTDKEISPGTYWIRRLGGPQRWSGCCGEEKNLTLSGIQPRIQPVARRYTDS